MNGLTGLALIGILLSWAGVAITWLSGDNYRAWIVGIGLIFIAAVFSLLIGLWERNFRPMFVHLVPVGLAIVYLASNYETADVSRLISGVQEDISGTEKCEVSSTPSRGDSVTFYKHCSEITLADVYWEAGITDEYYYWGEGEPRDPYGGCVISQFQDGIYDNANLMHFSKPCSRVTDADVEVYIPPGGSYYYWDWYETLNP